MFSRQAVKLLYHSPIALAGFGARTCYNSFNKKGTTPAGYASNSPTDKDLELINKLSNRYKHESVIEHVNFTFAIRTNRAVLQQLARHRIASFSVMSTRYTLKKALKDWETFKRNNIIFGDKEIASIKLAVLRPWYNEASFLLAKGYRNDDIKEIIPESLLTHVTLTMNARSLKNFFTLRLSKGAWKPMQELAYLMALKIANTIGFPQFQAFFGFVPSISALEELQNELYAYRVKEN